MIEIPPNVQLYEKAMRYAFITVIDSDLAGYRPIFGGGVIKHFIGKLGELAFYQFLKENGIPVKHTPFREDYRNLNDLDDFVIELQNTEKIIEVKTRTIRKFPPREVLYNAQQFKRAKSDLTVFCGVNKRLTRIVLLGWIPTSEIGKYPLCVENLKSPAYLIPTSCLRSLESLFRR